MERLDFAYRQELVPAFVLGGSYTIQWYEISVVAGGRKTPVFVVGQYLPKGPFVGPYFGSEARLLAPVGLLADVEETAKDVLLRLQDAFKLSGHELGLTPKWAAGSSEVGRKALG
jgi:hypothetical protein